MLEQWFYWCDLTEALKTHLIGEWERFGILDNDYAKFVTERSKIIAQKLNRKLRGPN